MGDVTINPDATPPAPTAAEKPDVDTLFGAKDVDDLFPADFKATNQPVRNVSPLQDMLFSNPGRAHARILDAFGYGFKQNWGASQKEFSEADEYLRKAGVYNDYEKGQHNIIKAANEAIMRPAVAAIVSGKAALSGAWGGVQGAIAQTGEEYGAPKLARDLAAFPEAFPSGFHQPMGIPHALPPAIEHAKSLDVIGAGEEGYFGTKPVEAEPAKVSAEAARSADIEHPVSEAPPSPAAPAPQPDIHQVAREIAPQTFNEFDALAQKKDTFRRWIDELRTTRDENARTSAPHAAEIADLEEKLKDATPRLAKKYQARLDPLVAERDQYLAEKTQGDSADMAKVRKQLMETDYRMRDLAPDVSKAYRDAEGRMPQAEASPEVIAHEPPPAEAAPAQVPAAGETEAQPVATGVAPSETTPQEVKATSRARNVTTSPHDVTASLPIAHAPSIVADVSQKLKAAGRPAEEADAAGQIVAAYWETRAQRFEGAKGTAAEMYAAEGPEIKAGKEKPSKTAKARELELAQRGKSFEQSAQTPAFKEWFGDSKVTDAAGNPRVVYHGTTSEITEFDKSKLGTATGAPSAEKGFFFTSDPNVAGSYAVGSNAYKDVPFLRFVNKLTGGYYEKFNEAILKATGRSAVRSGENIVPAYLSIKNPMEVEFNGQEYRERSFADLIDDAKAAGHDGVVFRDAVDPGFEGGEHPSDIYVAFEPNQIKSATGNRGTFDPNSAKIYEQEAKGRIRLRDDGRATITLLKNADASTFIHETGHEWLERMLDDARDGEAPQALKSDAETVLKWLGVDSPEAVKTRHHEKFARGFETYMLEGRAPSSALARVFAKFKDWLTTIYRTAASLKAPISDEIRGVFDRLLAEKPEKTVIAPEREIRGGLGERHEALVEGTAPERSREVANSLQAERDSHAAQNLVEDQGDDTRLADTSGRAQGHAAGSSEPARDADASGAAGEEIGAARGVGEIGGRGSEAAAEGAQSRKERHGGVVKAPTPLINFLASRGGLSAADELIEDLRQVIGGKNRYVPGYGQLIRTPKQISTSARKAGRFPAMPLDRAREAAVEAGILPENATVRDMLDMIDNEARGLVPFERPSDPAELAHAEHSFIEGVNDKVREAGGDELSDAERKRALELWRHEGLNDPHEIIERLALEADDHETAGGAPERGENIPGWDVAAPGWEAGADERASAPVAGERTAGAQPELAGSSAARIGGETEKLNPLDANARLPRPETRLIDKAGNIRLDNLGTPEDVNAVIRATADELAPYNEAITRGVIDDAEVVKLADALGMDASKLSERKLGEAFNAEQVVAARKLLIQSASNVREAMAKAAEGDEASIMAYAEAKSRHLMIQEQVSGLTAEAGRALRAFRALEGQKEASVISAFLQDNTGKTLYQLRREAQLGLALETPNDISRFVADSVKPTWKDKIIELWMSFLLSGARTHVANVLGNAIVDIWHPIETATAAAVGKLLGSEDRVLLGEAKGELLGMVMGAREGLVAAQKAFLTEEPQLTAARQAEKVQPKAIGGISGQIIRAPLRLLGAEDEFFKAVAFRSDIYRQAYVVAAKENLSPELMRNRVAQLITSPTDEMVTAAKKFADYQTFQNSLGKTGRAIQAFSNSHPLAKVVIPFVRTPLNLLKYAQERSPARLVQGVFNQEVRDNLSGKNGSRIRDTEIARITLGTMAGVAAFSYAAQGILTGGGPADDKKKAVMMADGWQPYSIKVGSMYYSYNRLDPFSIIIGTAADAYEIASAMGAEHPDKEHLLSLTFAAITKNVFNRTALQGISDFNKASSDPDRYFQNYVKGIVGSVVPALSAQAAQTLDPTVRETRSIIDNLKARVPFLSETLHPKRDIWGEPVVREGALGPDIASPIAESRLKNDPVNQALLNSGYYPSKPERKIRGIDLTDQQYDDFSRLAGRMAKMRLNAFVNTPGLSLMPKAVQAEKIRDIVNSARESARAMVIMQSAGSDNDIMKKASQAKTEKFKPAAVH